jgi:hypothetical protein
MTPLAIAILHAIAGTCFALSGALAIGALIATIVPNLSKIIAALRGGK